MTYVALEGRSDGPLVAYAIGRRFGSAVARNRARRRLREAFRQALGQLDGPLPYALLVSARPAVLDTPFPQLLGHAGEVLAAITSPRPAVRP